MGSDGGGGVNGEKDISFIDLCLVYKTDDPSFAPLRVTQSKNGPSYGERGRGERKQAPSALQSKLANAELSDLSVETILTE